MSWRAYLVKKDESRAGVPENVLDLTEVANLSITIG